MIAILVSLLWHLFWLSTITIVSRPDSSRHVKFSKVSFLGPLLGKGAMELQARPKERSFLEMKYLGTFSRLSQQPDRTYAASVNTYENNGAYHSRDETMTALIDDALSGEKLEPFYDME
jgi:hypothetical protein